MVSDQILSDDTGPPGKEIGGRFELKNAANTFQLQNAANSKENGRTFKTKILNGKTITLNGKKSPNNSGPNYNTLEENTADWTRQK